MRRLRYASTCLLVCVRFVTRIANRKRMVVSHTAKETITGAYFCRQVGASRQVVLDEIVDGKSMRYRWCPVVFERTFFST